MGTERPRHVPQRTCYGCRIKTDQKDLIRVGNGPGGLEVAGRTGRGVYVCRSEACLTKLLDRDRLARALRLTVSKEAKEAIRRDLWDKLR